MSGKFSPKGDTTNIAVTAAAQTLTFPNPISPSDIVRLCNIGTQTVFVHFTTTATVANGIPIPAGATETFAKGNLTSLSVIAGATGSTLYATVGDGF